MSEGGGIMRAVSEPAKMFGASPELFAASAGSSFVAFFMTLNGLVWVISFAVTHTIAVMLTIRDPDVTRVLMARWRTGRARSFRRRRGNHYVP